MHQKSPDMVVGDKEQTRDSKRQKKIRRILKENGILQKKLAQSYKGTRALQLFFSILVILLGYEL